MNNLILASALALSSIVAPVAAHAGGRDEFAMLHAAAAQHACAQPAFADRMSAQPPSYAPSIYVAHRDERGQRTERGHEARVERSQSRDAGGWQFSHGHEGWRR